MKKIKTFIGIALILTIVVNILGCGGNDDNSDTQTRCSNNPKPVILDNDNFDPDWLITLEGALNLDRQCQIDLKGIVVNGTDIRGRAGLVYQTVLEYYGVHDRIKLSVVNDRPQRTTPSPLMADNPKISSEYPGTYSSVLEFPSDGLGDSSRPNADLMLCDIYTNLDISKGKIIYITGGHLTGLESFLSTTVCDSIVLTKEKTEAFYWDTGYLKTNEGSPEMNFSQGEKKSTPASKAAVFVTNTLNSKMPEIPQYLPSIKDWKYSGRVGDEYKTGFKADSPMSFFNAVPKYGTFGDHGIGDARAVVVGAGAAQAAGAVRGPIQICIRLNQKNAMIYTKNSSECNHWTYEPTAIAGGYIEQFLHESVIMEK